MWRRHHYAGRGAPVSFAIAAVDIALWDLKGRVLGQPLWQLLGGYNPRVKVYAGNIDLNLAVPELLEGASKSIEAGHRSVKMRLGKPTLAEDLATFVGAERLYFYDSISPIVDAESIDTSIAFRASRYGRSLDDSADYLNCPLDKEQYARFLEALLEARRHPAQDRRFRAPCHGASG
jgi:hypothetical protein